MDVSIVLPAFREAENLNVLLPKIHLALAQYGSSYEILVIDTMSALDDTKAVCDANGAVYLPRRGGNHYGDAIRTGFQSATGDATLVMDCDGSHDPAEIPKMLQLLQSGADLIIGSRYVKDGQTENNVILKMMSHIVNVMYRMVFRIRVKDVSNSFRLYRTALIKWLDLACDNFDIVEEVLIRLTMLNPNLKIIEHPIIFQKRLYGESKRDLVKFIFSYITTMRRLSSIRKQARS